MDQKFLKLLDEIRAIAQNGLYYTKDNYDRERYEKLMNIATKEYSDICGINEASIKKIFEKELGYITPKVGVNGIIFFNDKILLEKRSDDNKWGIPGGWVEVGESPQESLVREIKEETNLDVKVGNIIDVYSRCPGDFGFPYSSCHLVFYCEVLNGELKKSFESKEVGFYNYKELTNWHMEHFSIVERVAKQVKLWK